MDITSSSMMNEQTISTQETNVESIIENPQVNDYEKSFSEEVINDIDTAEETSLLEVKNTSNGLENFGVDEETAPDLFSSDNENEESQDLLSTDINENNSEDDDLEIPAFLRRQKN